MSRGIIVQRRKEPTHKIWETHEVPTDGKDSSFIHVFCDGGGNRGPASLGVVVVIKGMVSMTFGHYLGDNLTNNIAELNAIWKSLRLVKHLAMPVRIYSDSKYALSSITGAYNGKKNRELIDNIIVYMSEYPHEISFVKVKGHSGLKYNEYADSIANNLLQMNKIVEKKKNGRKSKRNTE